MKLRDRKAFITGASRGIGRGIGRAIALAFAEEGAVLALSARSMDSLEKLAAEIEADGGKAVPIQIDVGSGARSPTHKRRSARSSVTSISSSTTPALREASKCSIWMTSTGSPTSTSTSPARSA